MTIMSSISSVFRRHPKASAESRSIENPTIPINAQQLAMILGYGPTHAGVEVNEISAMNCTAVFACVQILAESVGSLPLCVYERLPDGTTRKAESHPAYDLFAYEPNPYQTPSVFFETVQGHRSAWGNGYARIVWDNAGRPRQLLPLLPDRTTPVRKDGKLFYKVTVTQGQTEVLPAEDVLHVPGLGFDGVRGYSPIYQARQAIALNIAAETFGARLFGNGGWASGVLQHPGKLSPNAIENLRTSLNQMHQGSQNAFKPMILEEGMNWQATGIPPEDAQFLQTRKFQIQEIARMYRIPPHMLADLERATHSNIEHQGIEFLQFTMLPHLTKWEQEINRKLFGVASQGRYFVRFEFEPLLRSDKSSRFDTYTKGINSGVLSINEARAHEGLNPIDGGDIHLRPLNMQPVDAETEPEGGSGMMGIGSNTDPASTEDDAVDAKDDGLQQEGDRQLIAKAQARVFADAAARLIRKEVDRARRFVGKDDRAAFDAWLEKFYAEHTAHVREMFTPATEATIELLSGDGRKRRTAGAILSDYAKQHVDESVKQLRQAFEEHDIEGLCQEWETTRPAFICQLLTDRIVAEGK